MFLFLTGLLVIILLFIGVWSPSVFLSKILLSDMLLFACILMIDFKLND